MQSDFDFFFKYTFGNGKRRATVFIYRIRMMVNYDCLMKKHL